MIECCVALVLLAAAMMLTMQLGLWSYRSRARLAARFTALEVAANVLEEARALPWDEITGAWAESRRIPADLDSQLSDGTIDVRVEPVEGQPITKRVSVELRWMPEHDPESHSVRLIGLYSRRSMPLQGGEP
jgi:hypothetical protein